MSEQIKITKGYKVTDSDMRCQDFQYELNKVFKHNGKIKLCSTGFHFCPIANDCFNYYSFDSENRVFEIEAYGELETEENGDKCCAAEIKFLRELTWAEVLNIVNIGKDNTGRSNTGYRNTGYRNTGYSNTGDWNTGNRNTGDWNTGYRNTGYRNTGDWNTGDWNTGDSNTGDSNTGDSNTGDWNTGDWNTGYSNTGDRNTGAFCTIDAPFPLFNKPSNWTEQDFLYSTAYLLLREYVDTKIWVPDYAMTDEEKQANPSYKTAEGYVKDIPFKDAFKNAWHNWSEENRSAFTSLPNFDSQIFFEITGVTI